MNPPIPASSLDGCRVLLILLGRANPDNQYLLAGTARWTGSKLEVHGDGAGAPVPIPLVHAERSSFEPAMLPRLIGAEEHEAMAMRLAAQVYCCIPTLVDEPPDGALPTPGLIGGLGMGGDGELFLMQVR